MRGAGDSSKVALLLLAACLVSAGCLEAVEEPASSGSPDSAAPGGGGEPEPQGKLGSIRGEVLSSRGSPIMGAYITVVGTAIATESGTDGSFAFPEVEAGDYTLRVDAQYYEAFETVVGVERGRETQVVVTLFPTDGCEPHMHDYWGGAAYALLADLDVAVGGGSGSIDVQQAILDASLGGPNRQIPLPSKGPFVYPGTVNMTIGLGWKPAAGSTIDRIGFALQPAGEKSSAQRLAPKSTSNSVWSIPVDESMTDRPHAGTTAWKFFYYLPSGDGPNVARGTLHVKILIAKGDVPVDASCAGHNHQA